MYLETVYQPNSNYIMIIIILESFVENSGLPHSKLQISFLIDVIMFHKNQYLFPTESFEKLTNAVSGTRLPAKREHLHDEKQFVQRELQTKLSIRLKRMEIDQRNNLEVAGNDTVRYRMEMQDGQTARQLPNQS